MNKDLKIFIQCRIGSTRLPIKPLFPFKGKTIIEALVEGIREIGVCGHDIVLLTPDSQENLVLQFYADRLGINCFKGSEHNVFKRFQGALAQYNCENFVRLTGDNPMLPAEWLESYIDCHLCNRPVMTTSRKWSGNKIVEENFPRCFN